MRICWDNEVDKFVPAPSTEAGGFPATNVQHIHLARTWRTTADAGQYLTLDAGAGNTITATCAAIIGKSPYPHNLTGAVIAKIQAHPSDAWGAPDFEEVFTWDASTMLVFFSSTAKRFWRFYLDDAANPDGFLEIPRLFLGTYLQMPPIEPTPALPVLDTSVPIESIGGQTYGDLRLQKLIPAFALPIVSETDRQAINAMFATVRNCLPVLLVVWEDSLAVQGPIYCRINQEELGYRRDGDAGLLWSLDLQFLEVF